jgi:hypothetical protein
MIVQIPSPASFIYNGFIFKKIKKKKRFLVRNVEKPIFLFALFSLVKTTGEDADTPRQAHKTIFGRCNS